jgi:splicing factor 3B subunit 3
MRLPPGTTDDVNIDPTGDKGLWDRGLLNGASQKSNMMCTFYLGETISSLQKTTLIPGGSDALVYTTLSGTIGMLVPFSSNEVLEIRVVSINQLRFQIKLFFLFL